MYLFANININQLTRAKKGENQYIVVEFQFDHKFHLKPKSRIQQKKTTKEYSILFESSASKKEIC